MYIRIKPPVRKQKHIPGLLTFTMYISLSIIVLKTFFCSSLLYHYVLGYWCHKLDHNTFSFSTFCYISAPEIHYRTTYTNLHLFTSDKICHCIIFLLLSGIFRNFPFSRQQLRAFFVTLEIRTSANLRNHVTYSDTRKWLQRAPNPQK